MEPDANLHVVADAAVALVCSDTPAQCISVDLVTGASTAAAYVAPRAAIDPAELPHGTVERTGAFDACFGKRCRKLGRRLRGALAAFEAAVEGHPQDERWTSPSATTDLAAVSFMPPDTYGAQVWSVAREREMFDEGDKQDSSTIGRIIPVGRDLFVTAIPPSERVFTSAGKLIADVGDEGSQIRMLDATRWVLLSQHHELFIFEGDAGHHVRTIELSAAEPYDAMAAGIAVRADLSVMVAIQRPERPALLLIDPVRGGIVREWLLRRCTKST